MEYKLNRFLTAHQEDFNKALEEITSGKKRSHWMWYIFPQLKGLGFSETAQFYGIKDLTEAAQFLNNPVLGKNLIAISEALVGLTTNDPHEIFGSPDAQKLKSSMTLFAAIKNTNPVFEQVLHKYYNGMRDEQTLKMIDVKL